MKFFVDTAEISEIRELAETGLLDGVTTNPSLIMKAGRPIHVVIKESATRSKATSRRKSQRLISTA